jgi:hypothetical protein
MNELMILYMFLLWGMRQYLCSFRGQWKMVVLSPHREDRVAPIALQLRIHVFPLVSTLSSRAENYVGWLMVKFASQRYDGRSVGWESTALAQKNMETPATHLCFGGYWRPKGGDLSGKDVSFRDGSK